MRNIIVHAGWFNDIPIAHLYISQTRGKEQIGWQFTQEWLDSYSNVFLDPQLKPDLNIQFPDVPTIFGCLSDAIPDRWGQNLIHRQSILEARQQGLKPRQLYPSDYLFRVDDFSRMGGFRFSENGQFLSSKRIIPQTIDLRTLEQASLNIKTADPEIIRILQPGSSLGGARPKINVIDPNGHLLIAKFPSKNDFHDVEGWEYIVNRLAKDCDINVPDVNLYKFSEYGSTFLSKRFDRYGQQRIHFISAMTLLQQQDEDGNSKNVSYIDLFSPQDSLDIKRQRFIRAAFDIAISNHDAHLRNHGFLFDHHGSLFISPAYDLNPDPYNTETLALSITEDNPIASFENLIETSPYYDLEVEESINIIANIQVTILNNLDYYIRNVGIPKKEVDIMRNCFTRCEIDIDKNIFFNRSFY